jgi:hypothetical protein
MEKKMVELALDTIIASIYEIRGQKVMLDKDLAFLYGVTTGNLNKAVNSNLQRFPPDFMFELSKRRMGTAETFGRPGGMGRHPQTAKSLHRARGGYAFGRTEQRKSHFGKHSNHASLQPHKEQAVYA